MSMTLEEAYKRVDELEAKMSELMKRLTMGELDTLEHGTDDAEKVVNKPEKAKENKKEKVKEDKKEKVKVEKKKTMTGYLLYATENRETVKTQLKDVGNENPKPTEVITEVAKQWKALSKEDQDVWNKKAKTTVDEEK